MVMDRSYRGAKRAMVIDATTLYASLIGAASLVLMRENEADITEKRRGQV